MYVCVCVCVREREREREQSECVDVFTRKKIEKKCINKHAILPSVTESIYTQHRFNVIVLRLFLFLSRKNVHGKVKNNFENAKVQMSKSLIRPFKPLNVIMVHIISH